MTIRTKVIGYLLLVITLFVATSGYIIGRQRQANARLQSIHGFYFPLSRELSNFQFSVRLYEDGVRKYLQRVATETSKAIVLREPHPFRIEKKLKEIDGLLGQARETGVESVSEFQGKLMAIRGYLEDLRGANDASKYDAAFEGLRNELRQLSADVDAEIQRITGIAQFEGQQSLLVGLALSAILGCFGMVTLYLSNQALKPLPTLIDGVKKIADGDFNQSLKISTNANDEFSILAREYNRALVALAERDRRLEKQQKDFLQTERLAAVGQLSAEVVHEIRNPLNAISLNIDWLQNELQGTGEEIAQVLTSVSREIERLHQITECYLVRARVPTREGQRAPVNEAIKEVIDFCDQEDKVSNIEVATSLSPEEFFVATDKSRFKQALLNILKNAKEAMPRGGKILVTTEVLNNAYRIQVKDSGSGMSATTRHQSFRPFFTTKTNGTGLGLSVTRSIVEEAHGTIQCESRLGEGTTVTLQFPC